MTPARVVLDTNILISSLWGGLPRRIVNLWHTGQLRVLMSQAILNEYVAVLTRFQPALEDLDTFVAVLGHPRLTEWVRPKMGLNVIAADPADNRFLECAVKGGADALISGDHHLLSLKVYQGIPILTPAQFLRRGSSPR